jgi:hypothetical protein
MYLRRRVIAYSLNAVACVVDMKNLFLKPHGGKDESCVQQGDVDSIEQWRRPALVSIPLIFATDALPVWGPLQPKRLQSTENVATG